MTDPVQIVEDVASLTAEIAAKDPGLVQKLEALFHAKEQEFVKSFEARFGATPEVQPVPVVSTQKSQADVIAEMQATILSLQNQVNSNKASNEPVIMEGGTPVPHNLVLDNGQWVYNHPGLATDYSVTVPATATQDEHDETHKVIAAYPA